jgi:deoxycytidylate deaminase
MKKYLKTAIEQAKKSTYGYQLGAVVLKKNKIVGKGFNKLKTHRMLKERYGYYSIHSECAAILDGARGDTLVVVRIMKSGKLSCAKPCEKCVAFAKDFGIKKIIYSDWDASLQTIKLRDS